MRSSTGEFDQSMRSLFLEALAESAEDHRFLDSLPKGVWSGVLDAHRSAIDNGEVLDIPQPSLTASVAPFLHKDLSEQLAAVLADFSPGSLLYEARAGLGLFDAADESEYEVAVVDAATSFADLLNVHSLDDFVRLRANWNLVVGQCPQHVNTSAWVEREDETTLYVDRPTGQVLVAASSETPRKTGAAAGLSIRLLEHEYRHTQLRMTWNLGTTYGHTFDEIRANGGATHRFYSETARYLDVVSVATGRNWFEVLNRDVIGQSDAVEFYKNLKEAVGSSLFVLMATHRPPNYVAAPRLLTPWPEGQFEQRMVQALVVDQLHRRGGEDLLERAHVMSQKLFQRVPDAAAKFPSLSRYVGYEIPPLLEKPFTECRHMFLAQERSQQRPDAGDFGGRPTFALS